MMRATPRVAGLRRRLIVPVPVLTPRLSSLWVGLVTPVPGGHRPAAGRSRCATRWSATSTTSPRYVPDPPGGPLGFDRGARNWRCGGSARREVATRWSSAAVPGAPSDPLPTDPDWAGGSLYTDERAADGRCLAARRCGG